MSNSLAIAAVTATLQSILLKSVTADPDLNDATVTILPLDRARGNSNNNQLNLFLYQILPNAAWRNTDMPRQVQRGETGMSPLPLNLYYLLTAYGRDNDTAQPFGHELLGKAMSVLYDHSLLSSQDIKDATAGSLPRSDLDRQIERVRITLQPLSVEDVSKLWTGFATQYRLSTAYEVAVALIESAQAARTPLPVLTRGKGDQGVFSQSDLTPPFPGLDEVVLPNNQPSAKLGDVLTLNGHHLDGSNVGVMFNNFLWTNSIEVPPEPGGTATQVSVRVPNQVIVLNQPVTFTAGFYTLAVLVQRPGDSYRRSTNQLSLSLASSIAIAPATTPAGTITYTVTCSPDVRPEQRASLLLGDQEILANAHPAQTNNLMFTATNVNAGDYYVRIRVDGVDSLLVNRAVTPPVFDQTQKVTVT